MNRRYLAAHVCIALMCMVCNRADIRADDGPRPPWKTSHVTGTPTPPAPYTIRPAFPHLKFENPTSLIELPDDRMMVTEIGGRLLTFRKDASSSTVDLLLDLQGSRLLHATTHPNFEANGKLFVCYSRDGITYVSHFRVIGSPPKADPSSEVVLLSWPAGGHNGGCLGFGRDGILYISTGDGSGPNPPDSRDAAQDVSNLFGSVLRIDVDRQDEGRNYAIPPDNPFVEREDARSEIWAYGLRNPWKFGIDQATGELFVADNGWETWEMVHHVVRGGNCGWPIMEGRAMLRSEVQPGPTPIRPPVKDHPHTEANSVIGGPVYRGSKHPDLDGTFIYGDYITGTIWGLTIAGDDEYSSRMLVDTDQRIVAFAESAAGEIFVVDYDYTGQIYELIPSETEDRSADFPRRLSKTGLFKSLNEIAPAPGVVPYEVVVRRWMDGADTQRWVAIPGADTITLAGMNTVARFPEGTVFAKHLFVPSGVPEKRIPLETQLLHFENGVWHPYSYLWDDDGRDASLVETAGTNRELKSESGEVRTWHVGAENECRLCHNAGAGFVLGFEPNQLDRTAVGDGESSQLKSLSAAKVLATTPTFPYDNPGHLVDPYDDFQSVDDRARSYLHGNCSSCHHPDGNAIVSFYLRRDLPFDELRTNKPPGVGAFGLRDSQLVVPGDPFRSVLLYRMAKLGYARMPYIGSRLVDPQGVALIEEWIRSMPAADNASAPIPVQAESVERLLQTSEGALALAVTIHSGRADAQHAVLGYADGSSDIRGLFETFIPEHDRRKTLGQNVDPQAILSLRGSAERGRLIFYSDSARCQACHDRDDASKSTGPTLTEIRKKYSAIGEMLQQVLDPSQKVDDKFAMWGVVTNSGRVYNGLLVDQDDKEVVLKTADRKTIRISKSEIDVMQKSRQSLMPNGLLSDLTAQEAADLIAWFASP